jgi:outer membrane protein TolC
MMRLTASAAVAVLLAGCASFSQDGGFAQVGEMTKERVGQAPSLLRTADDTETARARVSELLKQPLTADSAVELAFLNNRGLHASFADLGIAESDLVRAGSLRNPSFRLGRLREAAGVVETERAVVFDVLGLLTMPLARQVERRRFEQAQLQAAYTAVGIASETRRAYFGAVATQELVTYHEQVKQAAEASSAWCRPATSTSCPSCASSRSTPTPRRNSPAPGTRGWPNASGWPACWGCGAIN